MEKLLLEELELNDEEEELLNELLLELLEKELELELLENENELDEDEELKLELELDELKELLELLLLNEELLEELLLLEDELLDIISITLINNKHSTIGVSHHFFLTFIKL